MKPQLPRDDAPVDQLPPDFEPGVPEWTKQEHQGPPPVNWEMVLVWVLLSVIIGEAMQIAVCFATLWVRDDIAAYDLGLTAGRITVVVAIPLAAAGFLFGMRLRLVGALVWSMIMGFTLLFAGFRILEAWFG